MAGAGLGRAPGLQTHCPVASPPPDAGLVVRTPGSATQNAACRCQDGTHCSSHECQTCRANKRCGLGEGVQQEGGSRGLGSQGWGDRWLKQGLSWELCSLAQTGWGGQRGGEGCFAHAQRQSC